MRSPSDPSGDDGSSFVRPYLMTRGRTRPSHDDVGLETMVHAVSEAPGPRLGPWDNAIVELCRDPIAVVEIALALELPVGVARVLVADLAAAGHLATNDDIDQITIVRSLLDGLQEG